MKWLNTLEKIKIDISREELKVRLAKLIREEEDPAILEEIHELLTNADSFELSSAHLAELAKSNADFKAGRVVSHEEVKEDAKKWLMD